MIKGNWIVRRCVTAGGTFSALYALDAHCSTQPVLQARSLTLPATEQLLFASQLSKHQPSEDRPVMPCFEALLNKFQWHVAALVDIGMLAGLLWSLRPQMWIFISQRTLAQMPESALMAGTHAACCGAAGSSEPGLATCIVQTGRVKACRLD